MQFETTSVYQHSCFQLRILVIFFLPPDGRDCHWAPDVFIWRETKDEIERERKK